MSDVAIGRPDGGSLFKPTTIALMILVGVVGFFGALTLGAYAPDLEGDGGPGGHALSNSAIGYSALVQLASATGRNPRILRDELTWQGEDLVVATPETAATNLNKIIAARGTTRATLYVLPKWKAQADDDHKGWVRIGGLLPAFEPEGVLAPGIRFSIKRHMKLVKTMTYAGDLPRAVVFSASDKLQVMVPLEQPHGASKGARPPVKGEAVGPAGADDVLDGKSYADLRPVITDGAGGIVLGQLDNMFILADPDLLDNAAMKRRENAGAALALLDWMNSTGAESIGFDVVLNGLGRTKSLLRLALDPPILAMTLTLAMMVILIGLRAAGRFGAPQPRARAIAFGKTALVDNGAMLVRKAGKARLLGGRFAAVIRDQAVQTFGVSARLTPPEVDRYLDGLGGTVPFTRLVEAAEAANSDGEMLAAARALHAWKQEVVGDD